MKIWLITKRALEEIYDIFFICPIHWLLRILLKRKDPNTETRFESFMNDHLYRPASQLTGRGELRTRRQSLRLWIIRRFLKITHDYDDPRVVRLQRKVMRAEIKRLERIMDETDEGVLKTN